MNRRTPTRTKRKHDHQLQSLKTRTKQKRKYKNQKNEKNSFVCVKQKLKGSDPEKSLSSARWARWASL